MDNSLDLRMPRERAPSMPGGFPTYLDVPPRQRSRSRPAAAASDTDTTYNNTSLSQPKPPKGILKNSPSRQKEEEQNRLAARFYLVPRPTQVHQQVHPPPLHSPTYYTSDNSTYGGFEGETDVNSTSSELSTNTQATSVVSSDFSDVKRGRPSVHARHVRPVSLPTSRVRPRPRTRPPSEVSRSEVTKGPSQTSGKRTVHIHIMPRKTTQVPASTPATVLALPPPPALASILPGPQSMQLAKIPSRALVHKLEQLESDTEELRYDRRQLARRLDDKEEELSVKVLENKQIVRALHQERNTKELILRDLEEQRKIFDEFRSNFDWQQSILMEVERERDSLRQAHSDAEGKLVNLEKDMSEREQKQQEQDELLRQQLSRLAITMTTLEEKVTISDEKLKSLTAERDDVQRLANEYQVQINMLRHMKRPTQEEKRAADELQKKLQFDLDTATAENGGLQAKIANLEGSIVSLQVQITDLEAAKKELDNTLASERASKYDLERSLLADKDGIEKQLRADKDILESRLLLDKDELQKVLIAEQEELKKQLETTKDNLEAQLQTTKDTFEDTKYELEAQLQATKDTLEDTKYELEKQLEYAKADLETQLETHKAEREELQQKIDAGEAAKGDLEKQLEMAKEELGREIAEAKDELEKQGAAWKVILDDKQSTVDGLITELAGAKNANIALASQRLDMERKLTEVEANLVTVQAELTDLQATHKTLVSDNEQLTAQTADLTQKAAGLEQLHTEKAVEIGKLQGEHAELDEKIKSLQSDLDAAQAAHATVQGEKEQMEGHIKELEDGSPILTRLKGEKEELEAQLASLQAEADKVAALAQANADLETRANSLLGKAAQVPSLEQLNTELEQAKADLEGRIAVAQGEASQLPGLRDQIEKLNLQILEMQSANLRPNRTPSQHRPPSRNSSRAPSKKHERHGRSPSSGFLFVRSSSDKGGQIYITTRDALAKEKEKGE
ncbi:hypothetical protein F4824DRAFT_232759 [Ustulina deusta]|nr:hypothetical protein F4824DRAFT_232759 [Ustulina deusta]